MQSGHQDKRNVVRHLPKNIMKLNPTSLNSGIREFAIRIRKTGSRDIWIYDITMKTEKIYEITNISS